ncbi:MULTISPECIES: serine hydrolase domain-containing protein [unclassified Streptomyces]|uniref:serine hydrolase domain-containing protein n=1 Tax=unclassified Streptomyces TaxID=2593676 RepID=UPI002E36CA39|nr:MULTISPECIES: serine hydrolase domain-containing protein [unclassified Streptomyces]WUC63381.1 beta-lactamase family protein [Streptomyces sp. NBC_00539]
MTSLREILASHVDSGYLAGAVGLVARGDRVEVAAVGSAGIGGLPPVARDTIFRVASLTKPVTAAAAMTLIEEGRLALDEPVRDLLPELASPVVVRTPSSPLDDVVPAERPITVEHLLTFRAGYGFPADFSLPAAQALFTELKQGPPQPQLTAEPDAWMKTLARIPLLYQPGEAWLYNACSDILGVLIARVSGQPLPEFLAERIFEPLGMRDTGFAVPAADLGRFTDYYRAGGEGALELVDAPDGQWSRMPAFPSAAGGLVSTADDLYAFGRMLLAGGTVDGRRLLRAESVRQMTTDRLTPAQRAGGALFLEGQGWGFGGSVDVARLNPWNEPGRYGWIGGTGTASHIVPATGTVTVLLTQRELSGPASPAHMQEFWRYAAGS